MDRKHIDRFDYEWDTSSMAIRDQFIKVLDLQIFRTHVVRLVRRLSKLIEIQGFQE